MISSSVNEAVVEVDELLETDLAIHILIKSPPNVYDVALKCLHGLVVQSELLVHVHLEKQTPDFVEFQITAFVDIVFLEAQSQIIVVFLQFSLQINFLRLFVIVNIAEKGGLVLED